MYICIEKNADGSHDYQIGGALQDGYAVIPSDMELPSTFPFVNIEVDYVTRPSFNDDGDITRLEVISMTEGEEIYIDEPVYASQLDIIEAQVTYTAMMTDTLLEV